MASRTAERFMSALQEAERTGDVGPLVGQFTDGAELSNLARPEPLRGRSGAEQFWRDYLAAFGRVRSRFTHTTEGDGRVVLEWLSEGTLPNGTPIRYRGVSVLELDGDRVRGFRSYYDSAAFLKEGAKGDAGR